MNFTKYHALGNDYIVVDPQDLGRELTQAEIKVLCNRHYGFGSDGVLFGPLPGDTSDFSLRIFNPDGGEAEKSGNGLRIFSRYLWDKQLVSDASFSIATKGGIVKAIVEGDGKSVAVEMGKVRFTHDMVGEPDVTRKVLVVADKQFGVYLANVGNPHCVIVVDELSSALAKDYGPLIEADSQFKNRTNVQFVKIIDRRNIQIEIWERGAGYTLASGSSSIAAATVAFALGLCDAQIAVHMPGGIIAITLDKQFFATMKGAVCKIGQGVLASEVIENL